MVFVFPPESDGGGGSWKREAGGRRRVMEGGLEGVGWVNVGRGDSKGFKICHQYIEERGGRMNEEKGVGERVREREKGKR